MSKKPMFSIAIILTLGVCIGAVTAVFSIVDATLLRPLPFPEPERLGQLVIRSQYQGRNGLQSGQDGATWETFSRSSTSVEFAIYSGGFSNLNFASDGKATYIRQQRIGAGFFRVFGILPEIGREFTVEEDVPNGPPVAILSHGLWQRVFGADPAVIGRTVTIAGLPYQIVGVASRRFESNAEVWTPLRPSRRGEGQGINYTMVGRLRPGVNWTQAETEMASLGLPLLQQRRLRTGATLEYGLMPLKEASANAIAGSLWMVLAATLLVLLIGCVNIAGLLIARGVSRGSEMATRMAIGANRGTIIRQLLSESLTLAIAGGVVGVVIGYFSLELMKSILPAAFSSLQAAQLDLRVLSAVAAVSMITSVMFGLLPAMQAGRVDIRTAQSGRGVVGSGRTLLRRTLSTVQIAIAVAILIGAGLLIRSFRYLYHLEPGLDPTNVITASFSLVDARYSGETAARYLEDVLTKLRELPGIEAAAVAHSLPYERGMNTVFRRPGDSQDGQARLTNLSYVSPQFFEAFRIPLLKGRLFSDADGPNSTPVLVINEAFAKFHFGTEDPIGAEIQFGPETRQIVGIVGDVLQQAGWGQFGPMGRIPSGYYPAAQARGFGLYAVSPSWIVRTAGPPAGLQRQIEAAIESVDPLLPVATFRSLDDINLRSLGFQRFMATLLGIAAGLSLLLASVGTYAMISNSVADRTREFGIRLALGATFRQTILASAAPGLVCAAIGLGLGLVLTRFGTRFLQGMLYGVTPVDRVTYVAVAGGVLIVVGIASLIPALRILKLDPSQTLRQE
jgi:predicted permease